jgi:phage/plasmid-associated DNA primase
VLDSAVGEDWFFEKTMMYHFNQPYREKSHVLVGGGGNGKSMFMGLVKRLYGDFALTDAPQPNFTGHAAAVIAYNFIGKRIVTFNDVGDPSVKFLEWMKRMITGNLEVKTPNGAWLSVPCNANFLMETNHAPQILSMEAHRRRFVIRQFDPDFRLKDWIGDHDLDRLGDRGDVTAADLVNYLLTIRDKVGNWASFGEEPQDLEWCEEEVAE